MTVELHLGDCLEIMKSIPDKSVDIVICDLPYGQINSQWDVQLPINILWNEYERVVKPCGAWSAARAAESAARAAALDEIETWLLNHIEQMEEWK